MSSPTKLTGLEVAGNASVSGALAVGAVNPTDDITMPAGKQIRPDRGAATATTGAATLSKQAGVITSEALTTAAGAAYTLTLTNTQVAATSIVLASVQKGTATEGTPVVETITPAAGSVVIVIRNNHATQALNGTIKISFVVFNGAA